MTVYRGEQAQVALREWLERQGRFTFRLIEEAKSPTAPVTLLEIEQDKRLSFAWGQVTRVEEDRSPQTGSKYIRVLLDDGRSFALAAAGIVFAPSFASTGPLPECPATASFTDFQRLRRHLDHLVTDHHDEHEREALQVLMVLLAFLDGARALGLDVSEEERDLDRILKQLEG